MELLLNSMFGTIGSSDIQFEVINFKNDILEIKSDLISVGRLWQAMTCQMKGLNIGGDVDLALRFHLLAIQEL